MSDVRAADADAARERPRVHGDDYVTVMVADQIFGIPIGSVHDVFVAGSVTRVPLGATKTERPIHPVRREMAIGLDHRGEVYGLFVDRVGEVMRLAADTREPNPVHMDPQWASLSRGVHRLDRLLLIILDVDAVLALEAPSRAA